MMKDNLYPARVDTAVFRFVYMDGVAEEFDSILQML